VRVNAAVRPCRQERPRAAGYSPSVGPIDSDDTWATTFDLLRNFGFVAGAAAILAEDRAPEALAEGLHRDLFQARGEERRGV
jgi:hypothetical protein